MRWAFKAGKGSWEGVVDQRTAMDGSVANSTPGVRL